jgi:hypothetical protein
MSKGYDPKCRELAQHFLEIDNPSDVEVVELAQHIQDAIEHWFVGRGPNLRHTPTNCREVRDE